MPGRNQIHPHTSAGALRVSVVLPVYNVARYLEQCLHSIQTQTLRDIEIIPVNDQSPDECQTIIDRLAAEDPRIRPIVLPENRGQGLARNVGIDAARGEFVFFIDSDDFLDDPSHLETLVDAAEANSARMTRGGKTCEQLESLTGEILSRRPDVTERCFVEPVATTTFRNHPALLHNRHFWTWLYRRDFLDRHEIRFDLPQWEERPFLLKALLRAERITITSKPGTVYRVRLDSTARREKTQADYDNQLRNFELTTGLLADAGAFDRENPLWPHARFTLSQYVQYLFFGHAYQLVKAGKVHDDMGQFLARIAAVYRSSCFRAADFSDAPQGLSPRHKSARAHQLIVAALNADRPDLLHAAVALKPIAQSTLYALTAQDPVNASEENLQSTLNRYARNALVTSAPRRIEKPSEKSRLILHIGASKTGSTYVQQVLEENRPALRRLGILYPETGLFWQASRPHKQAGHSGFLRAATTGNRSPRNQIFAGLRELGGAAHTVILSSEAFFLHPNADQLAAYLADFDVRVLVYLRRQDDWANSQYCEFVSGGAVGRVDVPIDDWLQTPQTRRHLDYAGMLERWASRVGHANIEVRVFDRDRLINGDIIADFAQATGCPDIADLPRPDPLSRNPAQLSTAHVRLFESYNRRPYRDQNAYFEFVEHVTNAMTRWRATRKLAMPKPDMLSPAQRQILMTDSAEGNALISRTYLNDEPLFSDESSTDHTRQEEPLHDEEIALFETIYGYYAPPATDSDARDLPGTPAIPEIVNYGFLGWRLRLLSPIVRLFLQRIGNADDLAIFDADPATFFRSLKSPFYRAISALLYPQWSTLGPFGVLRLWLPLLRPTVGRIGDPTDVTRMESNPVRFFRTLSDRRFRLAGRIFFPFGELRRRTFDAP